LTSSASCDWTILVFLSILFVTSGIVALVLLIVTRYKIVRSSLITAATGTISLVSCFIIVIVFICRIVGQ
jgi:hypothetical protein